MELGGLYIGHEKKDILTLSASRWNKSWKQTHEIGRYWDGCQVHSHGGRQGDHVACRALCRLIGGTAQPSPGRQVWCEVGQGWRL